MTAPVLEPDVDALPVVDEQPDEQCQAAHGPDERRCPLQARHELLWHCESGPAAHDFRSVFCCPHTGAVVFAHQRGRVGCEEHQDAVVRLVAVVDLKPH